MSEGQALGTPSEAIERCAPRIEGHLIRLMEGHDPFGHLFAIERLTRAARADFWEVQRQSEPGRGKR